MNKLERDGGDFARGYDTAVLAINEAIFERSRTGRRAAIQVSLFDVLAEPMSVPLLRCCSTTTPAPVRNPSASPTRRSRLRRLQDPGRGNPRNLPCRTTASG